MILRLASGLSLALGVTTMLVYLQVVIGKGPFAARDEHHLRLMKDRTTAPAAYQPMTFKDIRSLPRRRPFPEYVPIESRGVAVEGYVERMLRAVDGDFHLDLRGPEGPMTPYVIAEVTPQWSLASKHWSYERLVAAFHPTAGGATAWDDGPRRVRLSGWLAYDVPHERLRHPRIKPQSISSWEVHPVTRIEIWNDAQGRFVEYAH